MAEFVSVIHNGSLSSLLRSLSERPIALRPNLLNCGSYQRLLVDLVAPGSITIDPESDTASDSDIDTFPLRVVHCQPAALAPAAASCGSLALHVAVPFRKRSATPLCAIVRSRTGSFTAPVDLHPLPQKSAFSASCLCIVRLNDSSHSKVPACGVATVQLAGVDASNTLVLGNAISIVLSQSPAVRSNLRESEYHQQLIAAASSSAATYRSLRAFIHLVGLAFEERVSTSIAKQLFHICRKLGWSATAAAISCCCEISPATPPAATLQHLSHRAHSGALTTKHWPHNRHLRLHRKLHVCVWVQTVVLLYLMSRLINFGFKKHGYPYAARMLPGLLVILLLQVPAIIAAYRSKEACTPQWPSLHLRCLNIPLLAWTRVRNAVSVLQRKVPIRTIRF